MVFPTEFRVKKLKLKVELEVVFQPHEGYAFWEIPVLVSRGEYFYLSPADLMRSKQVVRHPERGKKWIESH